MAQRDFAAANNPTFASDRDAILLPFGRSSYLPAIVERCGGVAVPLDETTDRIVYRLPRPGGSVTLVYAGMGSPATANALEMIAANGARRVVVFGACGGVAPDLAVGELVVVSAAVRGEGTSRYYAPAAYPAAFALDLTAALWRHARMAPVAARTGVVYTTDAGYRQGPEVYEELAGMVVAVESECAAAAVVGARLGLAVGALLFCTDNVTRRVADDRGYRGLSRLEVRQGFVAGLDAVLATLAEA